MCSNKLCCFQKLETFGFSVMATCGWWAINMRNTVTLSFSRWDIFWRIVPFRITVGCALICLEPFARYEQRFSRYQHGWILLDLHGSVSRSFESSPLSEDASVFRFIARGAELSLPSESSSFAGAESFCFFLLPDFFLAAAWSKFKKVSIAKKIQRTGFCCVLTAISCYRCKTK